jgi:hypothetical protein
MSLLMDALKRAEKEKKKAAGNLSEGPSPISDEHLTGLEPLSREDETDLAAPPSIAENNISAVVAVTSEPPNGDLVLQRDLLSDQYVRYEYQNIAKTGNQPVTRLVC